MKKLFIFISLFLLYEEVGAQNIYSINGSTTSVVWCGNDTMTFVYPFVPSGSGNTVKLYRLGTTSSTSLTTGTNTSKKIGIPGIVVGGSAQYILVESISGIVDTMTDTITIIATKGSTSGAITGTTALVPGCQFDTITITNSISPSISSSALMYSIDYYVYQGTGNQFILPYMHNQLSGVYKTNYYATHTIYRYVTISGCANYSGKYTIVPNAQSSPIYISGQPILQVSGSSTIYTQNGGNPTPQNYGTVHIGGWHGYPIKVSRMYNGVFSLDTTIRTHVGSGPFDIKRYHPGTYTAIEWVPAGPPRTDTCISPWTGSAYIDSVDIIVLAIDSTNQFPIINNKPFYDFIAHGIGVTTTLYIESPTEGVFKVSDLFGRVVQTYYFSEGKTELNLSDIPAGMFVVSIQRTLLDSPIGERKHLKLVKAVSTP